jgi:hypothetical protein
MRLWTSGLIAVCAMSALGCGVGHRPYSVIAGTINLPGAVPQMKEIERGKSLVNTFKGTGYFLLIDDGPGTTSLDNHPSYAEYAESSVVVSGETAKFVTFVDASRAQPYFAGIYIVRPHSKLTVYAYCSNRYTRAQLSKCIRSMKLIKPVE